MKVLRTQGLGEHAFLSSSLIRHPSSFDLVAAEGIEPTSLDYRSSALPLSYTAGRDLTPKVLANFSPGFPTLGQSAGTELLTLKEFHPVP